MARMTGFEGLPKIEKITLTPEQEKRRAELEKVQLDGIDRYGDELLQKAVKKLVDKHARALEETRQKAREVVGKYAKGLARADMASKINTEVGETSKDFAPEELRKKMEEIYKELEAKLAD